MYTVGVMSVTGIMCPVLQPHMQNSLCCRLPVEHSNMVTVQVQSQLYATTGDAFACCCHSQVFQQGQPANEWTIRGLQPNNYFATADDAAVPLQLDQLPNDYITFQKDSFKIGSVAPASFDLPEFPCADRCPLTSVCTLLQLSGRVKTVWTGIKHSMFVTPRYMETQAAI